jgi:hypothetical protein
MVTDCCDPAEKVSYSTPPKAKSFRDCPVLGDCLRKSIMYIVAPLDVIPIGWTPQPGEKCKLQMIVRIHQAGQKQKPTEVDLFAVRLSARRTRKGVHNARDAVTGDMYQCMRGFLRPESATNSVNYLPVMPLFIQESTLRGQPSSRSAWDRALT